MIKTLDDLLCWLLDDAPWPISIAGFALLEAGAFMLGALLPLFVFWFLLFGWWI